MEVPPKAVSKISEANLLVGVKGACRPCGRFRRKEGLPVGGGLTVDRDCAVQCVGTEEGGVLIIMHGRSRVTIDPRVPTMPGRSASRFHRPVLICCLL